MTLVWLKDQITKCNRFCLKSMATIRSKTPTVFSLVFCGFFTFCQRFLSTAKTRKIFENSFKLSFKLITVSLVNWSKCYRFYRRFLMGVLNVALFNQWNWSSLPWLVYAKNQTKRVHRFPFRRNSRACLL